MTSIAKHLERIAGHLVSRCETVAVAESVTSGLIQAAFSRAENATNFFQGGITAYNLGQKTRHLKVEPVYAEQCNCISDVVASSMAQGVIDLFSSQWGLGITGYAAPVPALKIRSCFAFFAIAYKGQIVHRERIDTGKRGLYNVQQYYTTKVLQTFATYLL